MQRPLLVFVLLASLVAAPAQACTIADAQVAIIHSGLSSPLPELPANAIVAVVSFESTDVVALYRTGLRARVRRMIRGDYRHDVLIVWPSMESSCDVPFANGSSGIIVAIPRGERGGLVIVRPVMVMRGHGFVLPPPPTGPEGVRRIPLQ